MARLVSKDSVEIHKLRQLIAVQQENYEALETRKNRVIETLQAYIATLEKLADAYSKSKLKHSCVMPKGRGQG